MTGGSSSVDKNPKPVKDWSLSTPTSDGSYKCSVCDKAFPSYQALGGHKASHRVKPPISATNVLSCMPALSQSGGVHECSVCRRAFPSGQALGGHKRKHFEGVIGGKGARTASSNGGARNIDLNLPPSPELQCDKDVECVLPHFLYD